MATPANTGFRSGDFRTSDGVTLHYFEAGSGPLLVFVTGWTMPAWIWEHQIRHFSSSFRVVALDPRGQGASEKPAFGYHASRRALDIGELLHYLGGEPAIVVGWSLAVQEVLVLAQEQGTARLRAVVLVDHPLYIDPELSAAIAGDRVRSLQVEPEKWIRGFVDEIFLTPRPEGYLEKVTQAALLTPVNAAALMMANLHFVGPTDLRPAFDALDRPALCVFSSLDWSVKEAEEIRKSRPHVPVEVIDETSHALFVDQPEAFNRVLEAFLGSLPE